MLLILLSAWYNILMCAEACEQSTATNLPTSQTDLLPSTLYVSPSKVSAFTWWELVYMALVRGSRVCEYFSIEEGQNKHILLPCHLIRYNLFHERQRARHCTMPTHGLHKGRSPPRLQKKTETHVSHLSLSRGIPASACTENLTHWWMSHTKTILYVVYIYFQYFDQVASRWASRDCSGRIHGHTHLTKWRWRIALGPVQSRVSRSRAWNPGLSRRDGDKIEVNQLYSLQNVYTHYILYEVYMICLHQERDRKKRLTGDSTRNTSKL